MSDEAFAEHLGMLRDAAAAHHLEPAVVVALVDRESSFDPWAHRWEPGYRYLWHPVHRSAARAEKGMPPIGWPSWIDELAISGATEFNDQRTSWGLMQVMGSTARMLGYTEHLPRLCVAAVGVEVGCMYLAQLVERHGLEGGLEAYNDGRADNLGAGVEYSAAIVARAGDLATSRAFNRDPVA